MSNNLTTMKASFIISLVLLTMTTASSTTAIDEHGYVMYCPCMGRFGNQADHLLGALAFAKKLNRTLVIPPWISHDYRRGNSHIPFTKWFNMESLRKYHRAVEMSVFMRVLAPAVWPTAARKVYCHHLAAQRSVDKKSCPAKIGDPFGPFWDHFNVEFAESELLDISYHSSASDWNSKFPPQRHPVLAFMGAPAAYPVLEPHRKLQQYVEWSNTISTSRDKFISRALVQPYLAVHLRNGVDWARACEYVKDPGISYPFMSSPQCLGYAQPSKILFTKEMCAPSAVAIQQHVLELTKKHKFKSLFVATDKNAMIDDFERMFEANGLKVKVSRLPEDDLALDLAVAIQADGFVGTCASSVTAFAVRKRVTVGRWNEFFAVPDSPAVKHNEL